MKNSCEIIWLIQIFAVLLQCTNKVVHQYSDFRSPIQKINNSTNINN